ncbi:MAG: carbohydrate ABC transporter substrate-binding protein [Actinobacteria bacterium]|nr:carbohydrate ABC transporter substrate-binding protein [Actinomycetota bacterium]
MSRGRAFRVIAALAVSALTLSACSSNSDSGSDEVGGEINVFLIPSPSSTSIQSFIPEFEAQTGIKVNVSETPYGEAHQKQLLSYNQKAGAYDVAQFDNSFLAPFCQAKAMLPLDSYISGSKEYDINDFGQGQQDYGKCNGETLGLTLSTEPMIQWYRTDLYEKLGLKPATTWDEYYSNAKKVQSAGYGGQIMGFGPNVSWWWMTLVWSFGGSLYDDNLNPAVHQKALSPRLAMTQQASSLAKILERCSTIPVITEWRLTPRSIKMRARSALRQCLRVPLILPTLQVGISEFLQMPRIQTRLGSS